MRAKVLILTLTFTFALVGSVNAQGVAPEGYDRTGIEEPGQLAGTSLIQDLDEIKKRAIENIINRIRKGDTNVLRYVVYDVFAEVHKELLRESRERSAGNQNNTVSYYEVVGGKAALPAFYGCFDNQDPKVRLRCIGFLGDWIDDMGIEMAQIGKQALDRLNSNIETRIEVRYGLTLLQLKVLRKVYLNKIWNGDENVLKTISPEDFIVLVHNEPFIREVFCIPRDVRLQSIRLLQWWLTYYDHNGGVYWYRNAAEEETENIFTNRFTPFRNVTKELEHRKKVHDPANIYRNYGGEPARVLPMERRLTEGYGYQDPGKYQDIASIYDLRYFRYSNQQQVADNGFFQNEEKYTPAIFAGLENESLFVRENVARLLVRLSDGPLGWMRRGTDVNYNQFNIGSTAGGGSATGDFVPWSDEDSTKRPENRQATPYELLNDRNEIVGVEGVLSRLAKNKKYQEVLRNAWKQVMFAQFMDVHEISRVDSDDNNVSDGKYTFPNLYYPNEGIRLNRNVPFNGNHNAWGYKYNYRTDLADLMRRFGLGREIFFLSCERRKEEVIVVTGGQYFVEDLFDLDELYETPYPGSNVKVPLWHGKDLIKDEVFEP